MDTYNCGCKGVSIVENIFGEIVAGTPLRVAGRTRGDEEEEHYEGETSTISDDGDGKLDAIVKSYTMTNNNRMEVTVLNWGATISSIKCPDKYGNPRDVVLGFDDLEGYTDRSRNPFIGCVLGRCAGRIKDGSFSMKGKDYQLSRNDSNGHHLHGGANGFGRRVWESHVDGCSVVMSYSSPDGEEGYPGAVLSTVRFKLGPDNRLEICMRATTSKPTVVNMSHGSMFNLAGHDAGESELARHKVSLNCDRWTFAEYADPVPTGAIRGVGGTVMDLRIPRLLGEWMRKVPGGQGFDHNFCVVRTSQPGASFVAKVLHEKSGRVLEVYSDQPGVQFYTGGRLPCRETPLEGAASLEENVANDLGSRGEEENVEPRAGEPENIEFISGKDGARYAKQCAFSIQPQNYPNAVNYAHFPCSVLYPGQMYYHDLSYKFGIQLASHM